MTSTPLSVGDTVVDREAENPGAPGSRARVMNVLDKPASEVYIPQLNASVAEANPDYPADDTVIAIKFLSPLDGRPQGSTYEYPRSRLRRHTDDESGLRMDTDETDEVSNA